MGACPYCPLQPTVQAYVFWIYQAMPAEIVRFCPTSPVSAPAGPGALALAILISQLKRLAVFEKIAWPQGGAATAALTPYPFARLSGIQVGIDSIRDPVDLSMSSAEHSKRPLFARFARSGKKRSSRGEDRGEARLIDSAKLGDKRAIGELYRRHVDMIYRYTYARVQNAEVAEDLTAQVFLKALEGLPSYKSTGVPFRAWLYRIAHARTVDHWRQQQRRQEVELLDSLPAKDPGPADIVDARSQWDMVVDLLAQLTDEQRDVVILRFIEGMSLAEVAVTMDKTVGAVKALQHRALTALARLMQQRMAVPGDRDD